MMEEVTQYRIVCDACGKRTGQHHNYKALTKTTLAGGWESREVEHPVMPEAEFPVTLFRCRDCCKAGKKPVRWGCV